MAILSRRFVNSLTIAVSVDLVSVVLGAHGRGRCCGASAFPFKPAFEGLHGAADRRSRNLHGRVDAGVLRSRSCRGRPTCRGRSSLGAIIIAHISFCFPFVAVVVRARLAGFNRELEEAAKDLGAGEWQTFCDVLVPHMTPGADRRRAAGLHAQPR